MFDTIVYPFIDGLRNEFNFTPEESEKIKANLFVDGGDDQLEGFKDPDFQADLAQKHINAHNPAGGSTEITQAADQTVFRTINNVKNGLKASDVPKPSTNEYKAVSQVLCDHQTYLRNNSWELLPTTKVRKDIDALLRITICNQRAINVDTVKKSWIKTAHVVTNEDDKILLNVSTTVGRKI